MSHKKLTIITALTTTLLIGSYFVAANYGFFSGGTNAPSVPEDTMTRGLVGYWEFDEGTGQTAYDASDSSNDGQLGSTASSDDNDPVWSKGKNGGGMEFDGVDDYVDCGNGSSLNFGQNTDFTLAAWIKSSDLGSPASDQARIISKQDVDSPYYGYRVVVDSVTGKPHIAVLDSSGTHKAEATSMNLEDGSWYHLVGVADRNGNLTLYVDGVSMAVNTDTTDASDIDVSDNLEIGAQSVANRHFKGSIDSVRIYNRALSADEVRYHYNRGGPVGSWNFDEGSGLTAFDSTSNNNDGTLKSSGLEFDGSEYSGSLVSTSNLGSPNEITVSAWVKFNSTSSTQFLVSQGRDCYRGSGYSIYVCSNNLYFIINTKTAEAGGCDSVVSTSFSDTTSWHYITGTYDGIDTKLYLDGILKNTNSDTSGDIYYLYNEIFVIGRMSTHTLKYFNGSIDEVRIYNTALSAEEIARHYNNDFSQDPTGNLVLLQHFEEGLSCQSGACLTDDSGNGNNGTPTNFNNLTAWDNGTDGWVSEVKKPALRWTNGKWSTAGNFDGGGDNVYQAYDSDLDFGTGSFSVSSWFKHNTIATSSDYLLSRYDADQGFKIWMDNSGDMCFGIDDDATWDPDDSACTSGIDYDDNAWHHLSAYRDGTTGIYLYIDGSLAASDETLAATVTLSSNSAPLRIGSDAPNPLNSWEGMIDNVMIYPYVREPAEIRLDYNAGVATHLGPSGKTCSEDPAGCMDYGLVGSWGMDEGTGTTAYDSSDNSNNGSLESGPKWTADSSPLAGGGGSLKFDGVDDYVEVADSDELDGGSAITLMAWVYAETTGGGGYGRIIDKGNTNPYLMGIETASRVSIYINGDILACADGDFSLNSWYHIVGVYNSGVIKAIYINGKLSNSESQSGNITSDSTDLIIGNNVGRTRGFNGSIDEVRIYNRALSAEEVRYHYNKGGPVAEWKFDEGSGTNVYDSSGGGFHGVLTP